MAQVQAMLPNRNGMTTDHGLWPGKTLGTNKPDVRAVACMKDCPTSADVASSLPDFARNAHGNLAEQNRLVGAQRGADTSVAAATVATATPATAPVPAAPVATAAAPVPAAKAPAGKSPADAAAVALAQKYACVACHGMDKKILGPGFQEVAKRYAGRADGADYLAGKIRGGGTGVWGSVPMPAQTLSPAEAKQIAQWLMDGARK
jgi:cytochrome c